MAAPDSARRGLVASFREESSWFETFKERRTRGIRFCKEPWDTFYENQEFAAGEQWPEKRDEKKPGEKRPARLTMNEIRQVVQTLSGRQIMARFRREYVPRNRSQAPAAEAWTEVDRAIMESCDAEQAESMAFRDGPCIGGISCTRMFVDDLEDPDGRIVLEDVPLRQMLWPADECRKLNLTDRSWHIWGSWWPQADVKARWPDKIGEIEGRLGTGWEERQEQESSPIPWIGMAGQSDESFNVYDHRQKSLWIEHYECREVESRYEVAVPVDAESGEPLLGLTVDAALEAESQGQPLRVEPQEMETGDYAAFAKRYVEATGEPYPKRYARLVKRLVYKWAKVCGETALDDLEESPVGCFTFEFMTGNPFPKRDRTLWQGLVEDLKDTQRWKNVFLSLLVRILQVNPKGTLFYERGAFRSRSEAMAQFTSPGGVVELERGKLSRPGNKPFEFVSGVSSPAYGMVQSLMGYADQAIPRLAGFNAGALGQLGPDLRRISGEVVQSVQEAAMASNAHLFDALRLHRKRVGRMLIRFLRAFFEVEDVIAIVGEERAFREVIDPATGMPAVDPMTGEPQRELVIPPKEEWTERFWQKIAVEEMQASPDAIRETWMSLTETRALDMLLAPMEELGGQPLLSAEDLIELIPAMKEHVRDRIRSRAKSLKQAAMMQPPPIPGEGEEVVQ